MKIFIRLLLVFFILFLVLVGSGIFILTRPGVQKKLVESQLPAGSSIGSVRVTTGSLQLSELKLALSDGTELRLEALDTDFKPLDALFKNTVKFGALHVDGLVVQIPQSLIQGPKPSDPAVDPKDPNQTPKEDEVDVSMPEEASQEVAGGSPADALYAMSQIDWLFDIDSIRIDGELRDAAGSIYAMDLESGAIRPGQETTMNASLKLSSREALHAGLKDFDASVQLFLKQKIGGGFEQVRLESQTKASDQSGNNLLTVDQKLDLKVQGFEEQASLTVEFAADLPRPEIFVPEMVGMGPVNVKVSLAAGAQGNELTLTATDLLLSAGGAELASVKLNKQFNLGGENALSGNLMDLRIINLRLAWLAPWLPEGVSLTGSDFSAQFNLTGLAEGGLEMSSVTPLKVGPLSVSQDGTPVLNQVSILAQPVLRLNDDQSITWDLSQFQLMDRYGEILSGQSTGDFDSLATTEGLLPAGLQTQTKIDIGLQQVTQQPALAGRTSIIRGSVSLDLNYNSSATTPLQVEGQIKGLSTRASPAQREDYRFALDLKEPKAGQLGLNGQFEIGSGNRITSDMKLKGQVSPNAVPLDFKLDLTAPRLSQADLEFLSTAFQTQEQPGQVVSPGGSASSPPSASKPASGGQETAADVAGPPWAGYDGELNLSIAELFLTSGHVISEFTARAIITEPLLKLDYLKGTFEGSKLSGKGEARYSNRKRLAYAIQSEWTLKDFDPSIFSKRSSGNFPVQGMFDGTAQFSGLGSTLEEVVDAVEGQIIVTGREGVLTAFKLDTGSNLGLVGAGLLGQSLNRPGLTALAQAVPYFENMPFSDFTLKLGRSSDRRITIPMLRFVGDNLLINGTGNIAASSLKEVMKQPLDLSLELGAKGQLVNYLETLGLLGSETPEDGFRRWAGEIKIKGSLSDPDSSALERVLKGAANRALTQGTKKNQGTTPAGGNAANLSKEEKVLKDVEAGLNLFNSVLGK